MATAELLLQSAGGCHGNPAGRLPSKQLRIILKINKHMGEVGGERSPDWHNQFLIQSFPGDFDSLSRPGCNSSVISINWIWFNFNEFMTVPMRQLKWRTSIRHVKKQLLQSNRLQNLLNWLIIILALMKHINVIMGSYVLCCIRQWLTHNFDASFLVWIPNSHEFSQNILLCVFYCCIRQITCLSVNLWISLFITKPWCETSVSFHSKIHVTFRRILARIPNKSLAFLGLFWHLESVLYRIRILQQFEGCSTCQNRKIDPFQTLP